MHLIGIIIDQYYYIISEEEQPNQNPRIRWESHFFLFADIINQRLSGYVSLKLKNGNAGTRAHRSGEDHVRIITKKSVE